MVCSSPECMCLYTSALFQLLAILRMGGGEEVIEEKSIYAGPLFEIDG